MEVLDKLKEIGAKKINQDTKISMGMIENILEKRFDSIQRVWVMGFLPILEREYQVDLSQWLAEYDAYMLEHGASNGALNSTYKIRELELDTQKQKYDRRRKNHKNFGLSKIWILLLSVILVLMILFYVFFVGFEKVSYGDYESTGDNTNVVEMSTNTTTETGLYAKLNTNQKETTQNKVTPTPSKQPESIYNSLEDGVMMIEPKREIWFQVWNLETNVKQDRIIKEPYRLEIPQQKSIIVFGHRSFKMRYGNTIKDYEGGDSIRFICENGQISFIRYADYAKLVNATKKKFETPEEKKIEKKEEKSVGGIKVEKEGSGVENLEENKKEENIEENTIEDKNTEEDRREEQEDHREE
ncbi:hypothetical protein [Helicobacter anatolicus]|uniref:hypothetical protein n=1 Tax=Helicobacter anatolicus TaxID=2905874 RepID=UPI001E60EBD3|nr:hypothetical protein [Helicobacter anatolicus]MCE3039369.1 hypothetical protein [Helicobacter anatolicus]